MAHHWDSGFMVRMPSWHRLENAVLEKSPDSWQEARELAGLNWEVEPRQVFINTGTPGEPKLTQANGWQGLTRDDNGHLLSIQPASYEVIHNKEFGALMETLLGLEQNEKITFEALMSLYGGRQIVALVYFDEPLQMSWDNSKNYRYLAFSSRHDGQGGLRGIPTNVRVQCANTLSLAESVDGKRAGFTIRHSANWKERVDEIRTMLMAARGDSELWRKEMEQLARQPVTMNDARVFLQRLLPISDDMSSRMIENRMKDRQTVFHIHYNSETCADIKGNQYGLLMAATEWVDHYKPFRKEDTLVSRQLLLKEPTKARAVSILKDMAV